MILNDAAAFADDDDHADEAQQISADSTKRNDHPTAPPTMPISMHVLPAICHEMSRKKNMEDVIYMSEYAPPPAKKRLGRANAREQTRPNAAYVRRPSHRWFMMMWFWPGLWHWKEPVLEPSDSSWIMDLLLIVTQWRK